MVFYAATSILFLRMIIALSASKKANVSGSYLLELFRIDRECVFSVFLDLGMEGTFLATVTRNLFGDEKTLHVRRAMQISASRHAVFPSRIGYRYLLSRTGRADGSELSRRRRLLCYQRRVDVDARILVF